MGCLGTVASLLVVGFSTNFFMALFGRFLGGALNGNIGVIQTMVAEIVVNPKHEPKAYAIMPFVWSVGTIIGPSIGGCFAEPAKNFPKAFSKHGIFAQFPYLLPNLICVGLMLISIIAGYFCLQETHPDMQPWSTPQDLEDTRAVTPIFATQAGTTTAAADLTHESYGTFNPIEEEAIEDDWNVRPDGRSRTPSVNGDSSQKWCTRRVVMLTVALGIFTYHSMTYDHLLPIFFQDDRIPSDGEDLIVTSLQTGSLAGGLGLSTQDVGVIMSINGIIALLVQAVVFPLMASWLGIWRSFIVVTVLHPIAYFIVPYLALLPEDLLYPGIYGCLTMRNCSSIVAYPVLLILIKEASPGPSCLGKINGLAASTGAGCRTIASPVAGFLYGVGIKIDFTALAYWASAVVAVIGAIQAFFINQRKKGPQHEVHTVAPCRFMPSHERRARRKSSIVHIRVQPDSGYSSEDERAPLRPRRSTLV